MPASPGRDATLQALRGVTQQMQVLQEKMGRAEDQAQAAIERAQQSPSRAEVRRRLLLTVTAAALILLAIGVAASITLYQAAVNARQDLSQQVLTCFLRPGEKAPAVVQACDRRFSPQGHEYLNLQQRSDQATRQFVDLQRWAKEQGWKPPATPRQ